MSANPRYRPGGDNRLLRHILRQVWDQRCYWCHKFKDYLDLEIDHILPQVSSPEEKAELSQTLGVASDYDVHAVYNLAPICPDCNGSKSGMDLTTTGLVITKLKKARDLAPRVNDGVQRFGRASELGEALLIVAEADLQDAQIQATFAEGAPSIVQRLLELGEDLADYLTHREVAVEIAEADHIISITLNRHGRAAVGVFEDIAGGDLDQALITPLEDVYFQMAEAIADAFRYHDETSGADVGSVSITWPTLSIETMTYTAAPPSQLWFGFDGSFEGLADAGVVRSTADGSELEDVQGDAEFTCHFAFSLEWEPSDAPGHFTFSEAALDEVHIEATVDGKRSTEWFEWPEEEPN